MLSPTMSEQLAVLQRIEHFVGYVQEEDVVKNTNFLGIAFKIYWFALISTLQQSLLCT